MAEFETKLRWLSERGNPVGAEDLIERIEADLAGDPLVVVTKRREGAFMTNTQQPPATKQPSRYRGPAWELAAFVAILAVAGLYFAFSGDSDEVADTPPPPTTVAPDVETTVLDTETWEISIARAFFDARNAYDVESATALFTPDAHVHEDQLPFVTSVDMYPALFDWLRATEWQWMVDECHMKTGDGNTSCAYHVENAWTRAIGLAPVQGAINFEIWEGGMRWVPDFKVNQTDFNQGPIDAPNAQLVEVWRTVTDWIRANHPTDLGAMISPDGSAPILDARSIDLWRLYTQEFVEFHAP